MDRASRKPIGALPFTKEGFMEKHLFKISFIALVVFFSALFVKASNAAGFGDYLTDYEQVRQGQTSQTLGPAGGSGDVLERLVVTLDNTGFGAPCPTSYPVGSTSYPVGKVTIQDGSNTAIDVIKASFYFLNEHDRVKSIEIGARSTSGAWKVTTGCNIEVIGVGRFK